MTPPPNQRFSRRDFLRLAGLAPLGLLAPRWSTRLPGAASRPNVIVLVFDALSALDMSLYGYARDTTPNLNRLAQRAIVYHNHYAASNFTSSGAASLLTGTLPWTHRALLRYGRIARTLVDHNMFAALPDHYSIAYTHNAWADLFFKQFAAHIDEAVPLTKLFLGAWDARVPERFPQDQDEVTVAWARFLKPDEGHAYSLFLSRLYDDLHAQQLARYAAAFPYGLPMTSAQEPFLLEDAVDWLGSRLLQIPQPFAAYFHLLPPHAPYNPPREFSQRFVSDGTPPDGKPADLFVDPEDAYTPEQVRDQRARYDAFILYADKALGDLYNSLEASGLLDNTWLILTADHGEMLERGIVGHRTPVLYDPVVHIPLVIFEPGRTRRVDVHDFTSAIDVLPTLAHVAGQPGPSWVEGQVLPPFGPADAGRAVYAVQARESDPFRKLTRGSIMMLRDGYKLQYYFGYKDDGIRDFVLLHDIRTDPQELVDLSQSEAAISRKMLKELKVTVAEVNKPFRRGG